MITKNRQPDNILNEMISNAFPGKKASSVRELTEGMCNVTYDITFEDGDECILKISAKDRTGNTSNEINLMDAEVKAMQLVREHCSFKVADVFLYDFSRSVCDGDYFFMEKLPGTNYSFIKGDLPEETNSRIAREIGRISRELCRVTNPGFGFLGDTKRYDKLSDLVYTMLTNLISDGQKIAIDWGCDTDRLLERFGKERCIFDEVPSASLVHWDMWEGNVFVEGDHVSGIIDWERAMWGEALMDDRFRRHNLNKDFLEGFGKEGFTESEAKRLRWYDIILYMTMMLEVFYRGFEDKGQYHWSKEQLLAIMNEPGAKTD